MKAEIRIKDWLMAWLRPEIESSYNQIPREVMSNDSQESNFGAFIRQFRDDEQDQIFTDQEKITLEEIILKPIDFADGYPRNTKETIQVGAIYIVNGGWQQNSKYIGSNYWDGKASTYIAITGLTVGDNLNMAEPSLMMQVVTSLLIAGQSYFTAHHMVNQIIRETEYATDESNAYDKGFAMRTLTMSYDDHRHGVITHEGQRQVNSA